MHVSIIVLLLPESVRNVTNKIALYRRQSNGIHMKYMQGRRFNLRLSDQKKIVSEILSCAFTFDWNTFTERFWFLF